MLVMLTLGPIRSMFIPGRSTPLDHVRELNGSDPLNPVTGSDPTKVRMKTTARWKTWKGDPGLVL